MHAGTVAAGSSLPRPEALLRCLITYDPLWKYVPDCRGHCLFTDPSGVMPNGGPYLIVDSASRLFSNKGETFLALAVKIKHL